MRFFCALARPEKISGFRVVHGRGHSIQRDLQFGRDGQEHRLPAFLGSQENTPPVAIPADPVAFEHGHVANAQRGIAQRQDHGTGT